MLERVLLRLMSGDPEDDLSIYSSHGRPYYNYDDSLTHVKHYDDTLLHPKRNFDRNGWGGGYGR